jgi:hypothetical protein
MRSRHANPSAAFKAAVAALVLLLAASSMQAQERAVWKGVPRVVVVGDVHGAYGPLVELLQATGMIGSNLEWTGGDTHLVSLGDLLDRGAAARNVMDLVMRLQREAAAAGGHVHVVLGNHELMNLLGDLRYVSAEEYAAYAGDETAALRSAAFAAVATTARPESPVTQEAFDRAHPPGYFARQAAFAATGRYGSWLLSLPAIVVINDTAYVHGGLPPVVAAEALDLNERLRVSLNRYFTLRDDLVARGLLPLVDRGGDVEIARALIDTASPDVAPQLRELVVLGDAPELGPDGPLWYRGSIYCKPLLEEPTLDRALERLGVARAVVGHTPTPDRRVRSLYGGKLVTIDTGMLAEYFHGRAAALLLEGDELQVRYLMEPQRTDVEIGHAVAYGRTEAKLREGLGSGAVTAVERAEAPAPWHVTLQYEDTVIDASFYPRGGDRASDFELAAAALDDLLGTALVAPTVPRSIDGQEGALQLRYPDAITEADRQAQGRGFSGWCPLQPQLQLMYSFDLLTHNRGRTAANVVFSNDLTDLSLTDHRQAFGTERALPAGFDASGLSIPQPFVPILRALDEPQLEAALGAWLDSRRIRALLARRDELLAD